MINYLKEVKKTLQGSFCLLRVSDFQTRLTYISTCAFFHLNVISSGSQQWKNIKTVVYHSPEKVMVLPD